LASVLPILVLAATELEASDLRRESAAAHPAGSPVALARGLLAGQEVRIAVTGAGKSCAGFACGHLLALDDYRAVVNLGCAGSLPGSGLSTGEVVIARSEVLADEGTFTPEGFRSLEAIGLPLFEGEPPVHNRIPVELPSPLGEEELSLLSRELGFRVVLGPLATVSTITGTDRSAGEMRERWQPLAESMEGAAVALAALRRGLPFLEVRGISNPAGDRDRSRWELPLAAARAARTAARLIRGAGGWRRPAAGGARA
jgi:futalosine hydrolase